VDLSRSRPGGRPVVIIGGGLAGIAAALQVAQAGDRPLLVETRPRLGGRATSFVDPRSGELLDNCQHVVMGCCTNLLDLYERLGVLDLLEWSETTWWAAPPGAPAALRPARPAWLFPAPMHFAPSFLSLRILAGRDKRAIGWAMWRLIRIGAAGRVAWRERTFLEFLQETRQTPAAIDRFWAPVVVSACNLPVQRVSAAAAMHVFQEGFLAHRWSSAVGLATVPLEKLYGQVDAQLEEVGGSVRLGVSVKAIAYDGARVSGAVTDEGFLAASAVITAVPPDRLEKLISAPLRAADVRLQRLGRFEFSPIVGVHLRFGSPIMEVPHMVLPGRATQWLFDKGPGAEGGHRVHAVISAADEWVELDEATIVERVLEDIQACCPRAVGLRPTAFRAIKEKRATFSCLPGVESIRPGPAAAAAQGPGVRNLFLAGDWCDTGWPATMEGAVRSGYAAAAACSGSTGVVADVGGSTAA
jgi:zeta-carotene desaturase